MNDFNSRYRNLDDQPSTIRTNTGGYGGYNGYGNNGGGRYSNNGYGNDMDIMQAENAQKKKQVARASQARGGSSSRGRKAKRQMLIYGGIILAEVILLAVIWILYFTYSSGDSSSSNQANSESTEGTDSADGSSGQSGNINVENDKFTLTCNKISITTDANGSPVAVVYFDFTNKTENSLSMADTFEPSFMQDGATLMSATALAEAPAELANSATPVSNGQLITCAYAVVLNNTDSEVTISMTDKYESFGVIGSVTVPIK